MDFRRYRVLSQCYGVHQVIVLLLCLHCDFSETVCWQQVYMQNSTKSRTQMHNIKAAEGHHPCCKARFWKVTPIPGQPTKLHLTGCSAGKCRRGNCGLTLISLMMPAASSLLRTSQRPSLARMRASSWEESCCSSKSGIATTYRFNSRSPALQMQILYACPTLSPSEEA